MVLHIGGVADNAFLSTNGVSITLVYVDATQGWIITDSGSRSDVPTPEYVTATGGTVNIAVEITKFIRSQVTWHIHSYMCR
jgi:hypothetical protein